MTRRSLCYKVTQAPKIRRATRKLRPLANSNQGEQEIISLGFCTQGLGKSLFLLLKKGIPQNTRFAHVRRTEAAQLVFARNCCWVSSGSGHVYLGLACGLLGFLTKGAKGGLGFLTKGAKGRLGFLTKGAKGGAGFLTKGAKSGGWGFSQRARRGARRSRRLEMRLVFVEGVTGKCSCYQLVLLFVLFQNFHELANNPHLCRIFFCDDDGLVGAVKRVGS